MLTVVAYGIPGTRAVEAKGYAKEDGCRVTTFAECSARAFGDEKPPFTTRDANIRKAQKGNLASQSPSSSSKEWIMGTGKNNSKESLGASSTRMGTRGPR